MRLQQGRLCSSPTPKQPTTNEYKWGAVLPIGNTYLITPKKLAASFGRLAASDTQYKVVNELTATCSRGDGRAGPKRRHSMRRKSFMLVLPVAPERDTPSPVQDQHKRVSRSTLESLQALIMDFTVEGFVLLKNRNRIHKALGVFSTRHLIWADVCHKGPGSSAGSLRQSGRRKILPAQAGQVKPAPAEFFICTIGITARWTHMDTDGSLNRFLSRSPNHKKTKGRMGGWGGGEARCA